MKLLALINGKSSKIIESAGFADQKFNVVKIDEKDLAKPKSIINLIKSSNYDELYFGTIELELQRFQFFMFLYIALTIRKGGILDEKGAIRRFSFYLFIFKVIPLLVIEIFTTLFLIPYYYIKYPYMQWMLRK